MSEPDSNCPAPDLADLGALHPSTAGGRIYTPLPSQAVQLKIAQASQNGGSPKPSIPVIPKRHSPSGTTITMEDVRQFMFDRSGADNPLDLDLSFTEKDVAMAVRFTAMRYNAIPPNVIRVYPDHLPFGETMLNGIAYYLYLGKTQQLARNDVDYSAGNMTIDINKRRIEFLLGLMKPLKEAFENQAKIEKVTININNGFADVGGTYGWGY